MKKITFISLFLFFFSCMAGLFITSEIIDEKYPSPVIEDLLYLPSGRFLKGAALGFDEMLSDLLWIKALAYFAGHAEADQNYPWLAHILDVTTTLNPYYQYPYEFGGVILATEVGDVDKSNYLLEKGMKNVPRSHPRYWYFPFFMAYNYMYFKKDYKIAAHFLEIASKFPESPDYIPLLVSRLYTNADSPEIAIRFLEEMIKSTERPGLKKRLTIRLNELIHIYNLQVLQAAVDHFHSTFLKFPASLDELIEKGMLDFVPDDPRGGEYFISKNNHLVQNTKKAEDLKLHIHKQPKTIINMVPMK